MTLPISPLPTSTAGDFEARVKKLIAHTTTEVSQLSRLPPDVKCKNELEVEPDSNFQLIRLQTNEPEQFENCASSTPLKGGN